MSWKNSLVRQFKQPNGLLGRFAGFLMAHQHVNKLRNHWTLALLDLQATDRVLELGFGPGFAIEQAARKITKGKVIGIDHSATMLAQATRRNRQAMMENRVALYQKDVSELAKLHTPLDKVYSANVFQFWRNPVEVFGDLLTVLRPGGMVATTYQPRNKTVSVKGPEVVARYICACMSKAGYTDIKVEMLPIEPPAVCVLGSRPKSS